MTNSVPPGGEREFIIRPYRPTDADVLVVVFFRSVREAGLRDYSEAQVEAWGPQVPDAVLFQKWARDGRLVLVAVNKNDEPIAYGDLEPSGHIDHLYCLPEHTGTGVASALCDSLLSAAREQGRTRVYVEASEAAMRLFLTKDFDLLERRDFDLRGVRIHNYRMEKALSA